MSVLAIGDVGRKVKLAESGRGVAEVNTSLNM
jgi:hypothetical protein